MLKSRIKRRTTEGAHALTLLAGIRTSIATLCDDLLDLADIFRGDAGAALAGMAATEMAKRDLSL